VFEAASGQQMARLDHDGPVRAIALSADGRRIASASIDHSVRLLDWHPDDLFAAACVRLRRNLTEREWREYLGDEPYRQTCPDRA
jgi:hypothetical protein